MKIHLDHGLSVMWIPNYVYDDQNIHPIGINFKSTFKENCYYLIYNEYLKNWTVIKVLTHKAECQDQVKVLWHSIPVRNNTYLTASDFILRYLVGHGYVDIIEIDKESVHSDWKVLMANL